jgi:hypothetical protein
VLGNHGDETILEYIVGACTVQHAGGVLLWTCGDGVEEYAASSTPRVRSSCPAVVEAYLQSAGAHITDPFSSQAPALCSHCLHRPRCWGGGDAEPQQQQQTDAAVCSFYSAGVLEDEHYDHGDDGEETYEHLGPILVRVWSVCLGVRRGGGGVQARFGQLAQGGDGGERGRINALDSC